MLLTIKHSFDALIEAQKTYFEEYVVLSKHLLKLISDNHFDNLKNSLEERGNLLQKLNETHILISSQHTLTNEQKERFTEIIKEIKELEAQILTNISLKIDKANSEYESTAKGLTTLKGYRKTFFEDSKETIGII